MALLDNNDQWIYDDMSIQNHVIQFYSDLYSSNPQVNSDFGTVSSYPAIKEEDRIILEKEVTIEETKKALFSKGSYKSPGPDGYHPIFFKRQWYSIGNSIYRLVTDCFAKPSNIRELNQTLLTLIPKCDDPSRVAHLRPIALCNVSYKIVSKVIVQRLKNFLPYVIFANRSSFIAGRSTTDNILVMQEAIHSLNHLKGNKGFMFIKLDLEKTYDRLEWSFILNSLELLNIPVFIINLIYYCISSSNLSINWNGSKTEAFSASRGLRQGDPISPYLFIITLERLGHRILDLVNSGDWCPLTFGRGSHGPKFSHICFADDLVFFAEANMNQT